VASRAATGNSLSRPERLASARASAQRDAARGDPGKKGDDDVEPDREQQHLPRHHDFCDPEQEDNEGREDNDHDQVVDRDLDHRVGRIVPGQLAPDEDHGGAGCGAEQGQPRDILARRGGIDEIAKDDLEEQHAVPRPTPAPMPKATQSERPRSNRPRGQRTRGADFSDSDMTRAQAGVAGLQERLRQIVAEPDNA